MMEDVDRITGIVKDKTILITGGTGLVGKILWEKLLRMTEISKIYLLIRGRKGKQPSERLVEMLDNPLFDLLKTKMDVATIISKVRVVEGDCSVVGLGLSDEDRQEIIDNVEIIIHSAATVKFDEKLKRAIELNTRGAYEMTKLGLDCKKLITYMHVSTAYCHVNVKTLEEKRYPPPADPYKMMKLVECLSEQQIDAIEKSILGYVPNTYSFTKAMAETVVLDAMEHKGLPVVIMRPSIITPIYADPLPGWNDNQNGPSGLLIAAGRGVMRTSWIDQKSYGDFVPADIVVNSLIIGLWSHVNVRPTKHIFNLISSREILLKWEDITKIAMNLIDKYSFSFLLWYPTDYSTRHYWLYRLQAIFFHWIPAYALDGLVALLGFKPFFIKAHTKLAKGNETLAYYANNIWDFDNTNGNIVRKLLTAKEKKIYKCDANGVNVTEYFENCFLGARRYLLKEKDDSLPRSRKLIKILYVVDRLTKAIFYCFLAYCFWQYVIPMFVPKESMDIFSTSVKRALHFNNNSSTSASANISN